MEDGRDARPPSHPNSIGTDKKIPPKQSLDGTPSGVEEQSVAHANVDIEMQGGRIQPRRNRVACPRIVVIGIVRIVRRDCYTRCRTGSSYTTAHTNRGCTTRGPIRRPSTAIPRQIPNLPSHSQKSSSRKSRHPNRSGAKNLSPNRNRIRGTRENRFRASPVRCQTLGCQIRGSC